ncbi:sorting nexin-29-like [Xenia sp. Carnegie-2017]|uniref:sorting nexin-29-like n=1 Tax=Xenia sp. Carnegie-2017 TaxID=2897299 RepID=UPI001F04F660|nr:sorting nexin-29-like [Xenia sp. Carnegie-2017]
MLNLASVDITKQAIIDRLLDGVKQCQVRFGSTTELASEKDSRISCLCEQWNIVLQFGIKSTKKINSLRQVLMRSERQSVFWLFIKEHLSSSEIKTYNSLHNVMTDVGRAQAWLRSCLNEQSLEKYLHSFIGHKQLLFQYYEQDALLLDDERSSMLPMMAAGLSSILFAIDIDKAEFNSITVQIPGNISQAVSRPTSIWAVPSPMYATSGAPGEVC